MVLETEPARESFERGLYATFGAAYPGGYLMNNYQIIDGCRLRPNIPYADIVAYGLYKSDELVAATAYNENTERRLQLEDIGFNIDVVRPNHRFAEGLCMFSTLAKYETTIERFSILRKWGQLTFTEMRKRGVETWFGTCADNMKPFYRTLGCQFIDRTIYAGNTLHLFWAKTI